jgi:protein-S-isoprenylcysteine O-methyltransferase Ste14
MDQARYVVALLMLVTFPPAVLVWFLIHPFVSFWRRLGPTRTWLVLTPGMLIVGYACYRGREALLGADLGTSWVLIGLALPLMVLSGIVRHQHRKHLSFRVLTGIPELQPDGNPGKLLTDGIYGKLRHPRYVEIVIGFTAWALFANYVGSYLLLAAVLVALYMVVLLEEHELRKRFGEDYARYAARVPRFIPRR